MQIDIYGNEIYSIVPRIPPGQTEGAAQDGQQDFWRLLSVSGADRRLIVEALRPVPPIRGAMQLKSWN